MITECTYKDNKVNYLGNIISDIEFERIISDKHNEFYWLSKCKFKDAKIIIKKRWGKNYLIFSDGTWKDGIWEEGQFRDSVWKKGNWKSGFFKNSTWENGKWELGWFENSTWEKGIWQNGYFVSSTWENGYWENGSFKKSIWLDGIWEYGIWSIDQLTKCKDTAEFNHENILYALGTKTYFFNEIWNNAQLLKEISKRIKDALEENIHIGNHLLTKKQIEQRIKEIS